jgi:hypothetical protein
VSGTKSGGVNARDTNLKKYGENFYSRIGALGRSRGRTGVGYQNSAMVPDQRFQAAGSYRLIRPPRTGRRRILP